MKISFNHKYIKACHHLPRCQRGMASSLFIKELIFQCFILSKYTIINTSDYPSHSSASTVYGTGYWGSALIGGCRERVTPCSGFLGAEATERRVQREGHSLVGVHRG